MTVLQAIETGKITMEEVIDFMEGNLSSYEKIQSQLNEITGFSKTVIDINSDDDDWDTDVLKNCELIESYYF